MCIRAGAWAGAKLGKAYGGSFGEAVGGAVGGILGSIAGTHAGEYVFGNAARKLLNVAPDAALEKAYNYIGVKHDASNTAINKAYHQLSLTHHPDKKANGGSPEKWEILNTHIQGKFAALHASNCGFFLSNQLCSPFFALHAAPCRANSSDQGGTRMRLFRRRRCQRQRRALIAH